MGIKNNYTLMFKHIIGVGLKPIVSLFREKGVFHDRNTTYSTDCITTTHIVKL